MGQYAVYTTESFDKETDKLEKIEQDRINKLFLKLKDNPYTGDPLRYDFFREKRINGKRVYYLVYEDLMAVLFVSVSGKKAQQYIIDEVIKDLPLYKSYLIEKLGS